MKLSESNTPIRLGFFAAAILLFIQQVSAASCTGELKVSNQLDLDKARTCKTYSGNIVIDNSGATDLKLHGVELLEGDLIVTGNDALLAFSMPTVQGVNGQLRFANNKLLSSLDMRQLYAARSFEVSVHPALNELKFPAGLAEAEKITITDTTVTRVEGLKMKSAQDISISNNIYLKSFALANTTSVNNVLISANSPALHIDLGKVEGMREATFRNLAGLNLDGLTRVSGDMSFISNTFESLDLPSMVDIAGTLTLTDNTQLNNLSMAKLGHLGGALSVSGNNKLTSITAFPNLQQVDGTLDITGGFDEVQLPVLNDVRLRKKEIV
ncbi:hypothetical protein RO3G_06657 [Rhizopus delemar RA 99-880]|uniref:Receptor L-domain domain-containing protein n=1 Tax=Rhizopus delemar (strain RA 99-880 / ATCC MYA-4621 / FGSC 9543 / NRRL 43880) TaxID=246409 RepID=I1C0H2_RHIO9|nr:hypothetical protein RO3G_06657 [Rhizopus delemar RA 99-880]|eukprot:EIE81952.1 hypothetical protein RO3G_06657 [Rhizopus delemar RA 99-880]